MAANPTYLHGTTGHDQARRQRSRERVRKLAWLLDQAVTVPGTRFRFGLDPVLGLLPGMGDAVTTAMALWLVYEARELGAPKHVIVRMLGNVALDALVGTIPLVGDLFDFAFRANTRNLRLLQKHTGEPYIDGTTEDAELRRW